MPTIRAVRASSPVVSVSKANRFTPATSAHTSAQASGVSAMR